MTREKQIEKEAKRVSYNTDMYCYFIEGAEWADKTMINKACKWIECIDFEMEYHYSEDGYTFFDADKFIEDFRKAMQNE